MKLAAARQVAIGLMVQASPAWACTLCHSRVADQVRAAVLGVDLAAHVVALLSPAPLLLVAVLAARRLTP